MPSLQLVLKTNNNRIEGLCRGPNLLRVELNTMGKIYPRYKKKIWNILTSKVNNNNSSSYNSSLISAIKEEVKASLIIPIIIITKILVLITTTIFHLKIYNNNNLLHQVVLKISKFIPYRIRCRIVEHYNSKSCNRALRCKEVAELTKIDHYFNLYFGDY